MRSNALRRISSMTALRWTVSVSTRRTCTEQSRCACR
jgi:hypothetical protein